MNSDDRRRRMRVLREQLAQMAESVMVELLPADSNTSVQVVDTYLEATLGVCDYLTKARTRLSKAACKVNRLLVEDDM